MMRMTMHDSTFNCGIVLLLKSIKAIRPLQPPVQRCCWSY